MPTKIEASQCEFCGKVDTDYNIKIHEPECRKQHKHRQKQIEIYQQKTAERNAKAISIAKKSEGIKLLVRHGLIDDAKTLCRDASRFLWDCGTSSGWKEVYNAMIEHCLD